MSYFINSLFFYFLLPLYLGLALLLTFYHIPANFLNSLYLFILIVTIPVLFSWLFLPIKIRMSDYYQTMALNYQYRFVVLSFSFFVMFFAPIDIYVNGFKLLNPASYAELNGIGRFVRHITLLCWTLIPISFIFLRSPLMKTLFISYALIFPILIIDRNRFFTSCYTLFFCLTLIDDLPKNCKKKFSSKFFFFVIVPLICVFIFSVIGHFRSGDAFIVPSSGTRLKEGALPLVNAFASLPSLLQQVILYITTPIFNFVTIASQDFINQDILLMQISPFSRESFDLYQHVPVFVSKFNVGTEFYPFLLYGGLFLVVWAFLVMFVSFLAVFYLFKKKPNIFTFLIFLKVSYSVFFMGFAPQFYILLNLMFVFLMLFLWFFAELLKAALTPLSHQQGVSIEAC